MRNITNPEINPVGRGTALRVKVFDFQIPTVGVSRTTKFPKFMNIFGQNEKVWSYFVYSDDKFANEKKTNNQSNKKLEIKIKA